MFLNRLKNLRKELHKNPELSGCEESTAGIISDFIVESKPTNILTNMGGYGIVAVYEYSKEGPVIAIRCELDALPIVENNQFAHRSTVKGTSHKCGHDGHMTIVAGLAEWLGNASFKFGTAVLLFQPAEETGKGAEKVMQDKRFQELSIDYIFALHNIPGEHMHSIISMVDGFSAEVQSFAIKLNGKESHAAEPENGDNPAVAISKLIEEFNNLNESDPNESDFAVLTPVFAKLGQKSYGISPAVGELHYTIRTWTSKKMKILKSNLESMIERICESENLEFEVNWFEYFPASRNNQACNNLINQAAEENEMQIIKRPYPFKFGEDFGWYSKEYKTAMFGLGAGLNTPALHNATYDFPDEIIESGIVMFKSIISKILM